jgi:hypothetical protein
MGETISLNDYRKKHGNPMWLMCPNCEDESIIVPIVKPDSKGDRFISGLVCFGPQCPEEGGFMAEIVNGYPQP